MSSTALFRTEAELATAKIEPSGPLVVETSLGPVSQGLEPLWEELQTYAWARAWARHGLRPEGREAIIAVGYGADGKLLFLWPFETARICGLTVLSGLGQEHANYSMGLRLAIMDASFAQKARQLAAMGVGEVFDAPEGLVLTLSLAAIARAKRVIKSSPFYGGWRSATMRPSKPARLAWAGHRSAHIQELGGRNWRAPAYAPSASLPFMPAWNTATTN